MQQAMVLETLHGEGVHTFEVEIKLYLKRN